MTPPQKKDLASCLFRSLINPWPAWLSGCQMKCRVLLEKALSTEVPRIMCLTRVVTICPLYTSYELPLKTLLKPKIGFHSSELKTEVFSDPGGEEHGQTALSCNSFICMKFHEMFWQSQALTALCHVSHVWWLCVPVTRHMSPPLSSQTREFYGAGGMMFQPLKHGMTTNCKLFDNKL